MAVKVDRRVVLAALLGACSLWAYSFKAKKVPAEVPSPEQPEPTGDKIYVAANGNNVNNGTIDSPVLTLQRATDLCAPGDTVYVRGGIYGHQNFSKSGTAGNKITIRPYPGEAVIFDGGNVANTNVIQIGGDYNIFKGFEVRNGGPNAGGIITINTHDTEIRNNIVHDVGRNCIGCFGLNDTDSYNNQIEGNEVYHACRDNSVRGQASGWGQAIAHFRSTGGTIINNYVHNNWGEGIVSVLCSGVTIKDNHIRDNYSVQLYLDNAQGAMVQNNRVWHTYNTGFYRFNGPGHGIQIANEVYSEGYLASSNINVTSNFIGGCGDVSPASSNHAVKYMSYGAGGGLINSTITPNTVYSTPEPVAGMAPAWSRPTT